MVATPFHPSLEVEFVFEQNVTPETQNLDAFAFGPAATLARYDESNLKADSKVGQYDSDGSLLEGEYKTSYQWPNRPAGGILDTDYTRLFIENAVLRYWQQAAGTMWANSLNEIEHPTLSFTTEDSAFPHSSAFGDRGVQIGDLVRVKGLDAAAEAFDIVTRVIGFGGQSSASAVGAALASAGNQPAVGADVESVAAGGSNVTDMTVVASAGMYEGYKTNNISEVYTLEAIQASTGGDPSTARFRVTSASGLDDVVSFAPAASGVDAELGTRGALITFTTGTTDIALGDTFTVTITQQYVLPTLTVTGSYDATDEVDRTYLIEVIQGGDANEDSVVQVTEISGADVTSNVTIASDGGVSPAFDVGSYGIKLQFTLDEDHGGLVLGDKWTITGTAAAATARTALKLAHNLPSSIELGADNAADIALEVELFLTANAEIERETGVVGLQQFDDRDNELLVAANLSLTIASWTVNGSPAALPIVSDELFGPNFNVLFATHRHWHPQAGNIVTITSDTSPASVLPGTNHPDNPALYTATKMAAVSAGRPIHIYVVGNPADITGWNRALDLSSDRTDTYGLVPLTRDPVVFDAVAAHIAQMNAPSINRYRVAWFTSEVPTQQAVISDALSDDSQIVLATIVDDPNQTGNQFRLVEITSGNAGFLEAAVRTGDKLRFQFETDALGNETYTEYEVDTVINESSLVLKTGPSSSQTVPRRIEVHRTLTSADQVEVIQNDIEPYSFDATQLANLAAGQYTGYLFRYLPFGFVEDAGRRVPSYAMAATIAAARSGVAPHQPLTRTVLSGFSDVTDLADFSVNELDNIAAAGGFLVTKNPVTGDVEIRHAVTSAAIDDVNQREESVVSNLHSCSFQVVNLLDPLVGRSNVTDALLAGIRGELEALGSFLLSANFSPTLGGQILDQTILQVRPSPIFDDGILVQIAWDLPAPANRIQTTIFVS